MRLYRDCRDAMSRRWLGRLALAAMLLGVVGWSLVAQPPAEEVVTPERIAALLARLGSLDRAGKSAVLDFFVEVANKPGEYLRDSRPLQLALRNAGPIIAKLADDPDLEFRCQVLTTLGQIRCAADVVAPVWGKALAENQFRLDRAVGAGVLAYLKRAHLLRDSGGGQVSVRVGFLEAMFADLNGIAPLLPRLQRSPVAATRINVYVAIGAFFELLEYTQDISGTESAVPLADLKRQVAQMPTKLSGFFAEAKRVLDDPQAVETRDLLVNFEHIADVCISREENLVTQQTPHRASGRLLQPDLDPQGREAARELQAEFRRLVPAISRRLTAPELEVRLAACELLEALGKEAEAVLPALLEALHDFNPFVRWAAVRTLGKLNPSQPGDAARIVLAFVPLLSDEDLGVRGVTALALERYGEQAAPAVAGLSELAKRKDAVLQLSAVRALSAVGPAAEGAIPGLLVALRSQDERVREMVPPILGRLGRHASSAVPGLREALTDASSSVRLRAAQALVQIEVPSVPPAPGTPPPGD